MKFFWSGKGNQGIEILTCYDVTLDINKELIIAFKEVIKGYWEKYGLDSEKVIDKDKITGWDATIRFRFLIRENDEDRFVNTMEAFFKKHLPNEKYKITGRRRKKK